MDVIQYPPVSKARFIDVVEDLGSLGCEVLNEQLNVGAIAVQFDVRGPSGMSRSSIDTTLRKAGFFAGPSACLEPLYAGRKYYTFGVGGGFWLAFGNDGLDANSHVELLWHGKLTRSYVAHLKNDRRALSFRRV